MGKVAAAAGLKEQRWLNYRDVEKALVDKKRLFAEVFFPAARLAVVARLDFA